MKKALSWTDAKLGLLGQRICAATEIDTASLAILRCVAGVFLLVFSTPYFSWINNTPAGLFEPPILSIAYLFDGFPPAWILTTWDIAVPLLAVCIAVGYRTRAACIILTLGNFLAASFAYSYGKIDHDIMYKTVFACLAFTNAGTRFALRADPLVDEKLQRKAMALLGVLIAFGMFSAGLEKAYVWVDFDPNTSGFFSWFYSGYYSLGRQYLLAPMVLNLPPQLFELADYGAVAFETSGFLFLVLGKRAWQFWLTVACLFHTLNTYLLNIGFIEHSIIYALFLFPLLPERTRLKLLNILEAKRASMLVLTALALGFAGIHIWQRANGAGSEYLFITEAATARLANLYASLAAWSVLTPIAITLWITSKKRGSSRSAPHGN